MQRIPVYLLLLLAICHYGFSLQCYKCNGCETASTQKEVCREVDPETQINACVTQKIRTGGSAESMTIKKCVHYGKHEDFECPTLPSGDTVLCHVCHNDFCNSGTKVTTTVGTYSAFCLLLILPKILYNW